MKHASLLTSAAVALAFAAAPAAAGLTGDSITGEYRFPDIATVYGNYSFSPSPTFVVGAGSEATGFVDGYPIDIDFSDNMLVMTLPSVTWSSSSFNGFYFTNNSGDFGSILSMSGAVSATLVAPNILAVNWQGLSYSPGDIVKVTFGMGAVPEAGTWAMMIAGLGAVGFSMRRRTVKVQMA